MTEKTLYRPLMKGEQLHGDSRKYQRIAHGKKPIGWYGDSERHRMAKYGIKTGKSIYLLPEYHKVQGVRPLNVFGSRFSYNLFVEGKKLKGEYELVGADVSKGLEYKRLNVSDSKKEIKTKLKKGEF